MLHPRFHSRDSLPTYLRTFSIGAPTQGVKPQGGYGSARAGQKPKNDDQWTLPQIASRWGIPADPMEELTWQLCVASQPDQRDDPTVSIVEDAIAEIVAANIERGWG